MSQIAFVFPGQGSQSIGMLGELASRYPLIIECFDRVSDALGFNLWTLLINGPLEQLNQTEHTQVAMLTADVAVFKLLQQLGLPPINMMAGHSLGEYAALVAADSLSITEAAKLVQKRGQLMQETVPLGQGAMAAIVGLENNDVEAICNEVSTPLEQVSPANYNAIGQVVIAGHTKAVEHAIQLAISKNARLAAVIPVSVPCHCPLLKEAASLFEEYLQRAPFKVPSLPVISNVDVSVYESVEQIRHLLKEQLYRPVRFVETIQKMQKSGIDLVVECGPGKVLSGLIRRIDKSMEAIAVNDIANLDVALLKFK